MDGMGWTDNGSGEWEIDDRAQGDGKNDRGVLGETVGEKKAIQVSMVSMERASIERWTATKTARKRSGRGRWIPTGRQRQRAKQACRVSSPCYRAGLYRDGSIDVFCPCFDMSFPVFSLVLSCLFSCYVLCRRRCGRRGKVCGQPVSPGNSGCRQRKKRLSVNGKEKTLLLANTHIKNVASPLRNSRQKGH